MHPNFSMNCKSFYPGQQWQNKETLEVVYILKVTPIAGFGGSVDFTVQYLTQDNLRHTNTSTDFIDSNRYVLPMKGY